MVAEQIKKKYKANEKTFKFVTFLILFITMLILFIYFGTKDWEADMEVVPDNIHFINDYQSIDKNNIFVYKKGSEIIKTLTEGTGLVFLCSPKIDWCHSYAEILNDTAKEAGINEIYYYDIYMDRQKQNQAYKDFLSVLDNYLIKDDEDNKRIHLPALYVVKNGEIVGCNYDTALTLGSDTAINYWNIDRIIEIKAKLSELYSNIIEDSVNELEDGVE